MCTRIQNSRAWDAYAFWCLLGYRVLYLYTIGMQIIT